MMEVTPKIHNTNVRRIISKVLASDGASEDSKILLESAINESRVADAMCAKYYVDVRAFLAYVSNTYGREKMAEFTELFHSYRNAI